MELSLKLKYHEFGKLFSICIYLVLSIYYLVFSIYYLVFSTLPFEKQVLFIIIFVLIMFFKPNVTAVHLGFSIFCARQSFLKYNRGAFRLFKFRGRQPPWKFNCRALSFFEFHTRPSLWKSNCRAFFFKFQCTAISLKI